MINNLLQQLCLNKCKMFCHGHFYATYLSHNILVNLAVVLYMSLIPCYATSCTFGCIKTKVPKLVLCVPYCTVLSYVAAFCSIIVIVTITATATSITTTIVIRQMTLRHVHITTTMRQNCYFLKMSENNHIAISEPMLA